MDKNVCPLRGKRHGRPRRDSQWTEQRPRKWPACPQAWEPGIWSVASGGPWPPRCRREASLEPQPLLPLPTPSGAASGQASTASPSGWSQRPCGCCLIKGLFFPRQTSRDGEWNRGEARGLSDLGARAGLDLPPLVPFALRGLPGCPLTAPPSVPSVCCWAQLMSSFLCFQQPRPALYPQPCSSLTPPADLSLEPLPGEARLTPRTVRPPLVGSYTVRGLPW